MNKITLCAGVGCGKPAGTLKCPTCSKLNMPPSFFCSQECFKANWPIHKLTHVENNTLTEKPVDERFIGFEYLGKLRKGKISPKREVPPHIKRTDYADHPQGLPLSEMKNQRGNHIKVYNPQEIQKMRKACELGREILDLAGKMVKVGVTTDEIDRVVHEACVERNCYPSPLNYFGFPKSCCTSVNEIICHGIPDDTVLQDGDIVNVDVSVYYDGFHADLNETYLVGEVDEEGKHLVKTTYECLELAIAICKPGIPYRNVGDVIHKHAAKNGLSVVRSYCGHGVGDLFHCDPTVPHYGKNKAKGIMKPGHIFTIEPMINVGTWEDVTWPDKWTSSTKDGKRSAQFEHTLLITEKGVEVLTKRKTGSYIDRF